MWAVCTRRHWPHVPAAFASIEINRAFVICQYFIVNPASVIQVPEALLFIHPSLNPGFLFTDPERVLIMPRSRNRRGNQIPEPSQKLELINLLTDIMQSLSGEPRRTTDPEAVAAEIMERQKKRMLQNVREISAYVYQFLSLAFS